MPAAYLSLLLADGRLPNGGHTQSAGVEPALNAGLVLAELPSYVIARLRTVVEVEAATAVVAGGRWRATRSVSALEEVDWAWRVRTASEALREASDLLARSQLRLAAAVWPELAELTAGGLRWCRAVALGVTAAAAGLDAEETARLVGYDDVQTVLTAALKLRPFDPAVAVTWSVAAADEVEGMVARVAHILQPDDIPAHTAPQIEHWGEVHRSTERRLFRA